MHSELSMQETIFSKLLQHLYLLSKFPQRNLPAVQEFVQTETRKPIGSSVFSQLSNFKPSPKYISRGAGGESTMENGGSLKHSEVGGPVVAQVPRTQKGIVICTTIPILTSLELSY